MTNKHGVEASGVCAHPDTLCMDCSDQLTCEFSGENTHSPVISIAPPPTPAPLTENEKVQWVALTGSRSHWQWDLITAICDMACRKFPNARFLVGDAFGFDRMARHTVENNFNRKITEMSANWETIGTSAGFARNWALAMKADVVVALWDGISRGTKHTIDCARQMDKRVIVWTVPAVPNPNPKYQRK